MTMTMEGRASAGPNSRSKNDNPNLVRVISLDAPGSGYGSGNTSSSKMEEESSVFLGNEEGRRSISENLPAEDLHQTVKPGEGVDALSVAGKAGFEAEGVSAEKEVVGNKGADKSDGLVVQEESGGTKKGIINLSTELPVAEKGTAGDGEKKVQELTLNEFADEKKETGKEKQSVSVSSGDDIFVSSENDKETSENGEKKETKEPNIPTYGRGEISRHLGSLAKDGGGVGQGGVKIGEFGDFDEEKMTREQVEPSDKGKGGENKEDEFEDLNKLSAEAGVGVPEQKNEPDDFTSRQPERTTVVTGIEKEKMKDKGRRKEKEENEAVSPKQVTVDEELLSVDSNESELKQEADELVTEAPNTKKPEETNNISEDYEERKKAEKGLTLGKEGKEEKVNEGMKREETAEDEVGFPEAKRELSPEEKERLVELIGKFKELQEELERLQVLLTELKGQERDVLNKVEDAGLDGVSLDALKGEIEENEERISNLKGDLKEVVDDLLQEIENNALVAKKIAEEPVLMKNRALAEEVKSVQENRLKAVTGNDTENRLASEQVKEELVATEKQSELERTGGGPSSVGKEKEQETDAGFEVKKINEKEVGISVEGPEKLLPAIKEAILLLDKEVSEEEARSMANSILTDLMKESLRAMAEKGYGRRGAILENEKLWSSLSSKDEIKVVLDDRGLRLSVAKVEEVLNS